MRPVSASSSTRMPSRSTDCNERTAEMNASLTDRTADDWRRAAAALTPETRLFLDGEYTEALDGATFDDESARDGSVLAKVAAGSTADVDRAVRSARRAFVDG